MLAIDLHYHAFPFQSTHDFLKNGAEKIRRNGVFLPNPSPHVDDDFLVEWRDLCREVAVELTKYSYILSRHTLVSQGFDNRFCLNGVEGFLQIDECET